MAFACECISFLSHVRVSVLVLVHVCVCVRVQGFSQVFSRHPQNVFLAFQFTTKTFWEIIAKVFHKMKAHKFPTTTREKGGEADTRGQEE